MRVTCPKCGAAWDSGKSLVGVRDECPECAAFLHTCVTCCHYMPRRKGCGLPNTEAVASPTDQNFCEDYGYGPVEPGAGAEGGGLPDAEDAARKRFDQLFGGGGS